ncbi:hypothetical protein [Komagataeibacter sp. FNDCR2]|uniref:hypothetical protein n=1 Tax=Komagataeibacter sp. FNDCR2 TaxID=2878682 RepID=UPI001E4C46A4|nr:hypothetical protein [Komagataeibacter sp. FNDCR2]MCE2576007.1 hypothetical protein [Komagataeibacter sp. FNDCR2]
MSHNYAADSTFQDVMARLAGTDAPFSSVWPTIRGAILSGRALTMAEYRPLNVLIGEAHAARIARNEALNAPRMHSTVGDVAHSVGATDDQKLTSSTTVATVIPASFVEKVQENLKAPAEATVESKPEEASTSGEKEGRADEIPTKSD